MTLAVGAAALLLSACLPPPPPPPPPPPAQDCLPQAPASAADYQALFSKRSTWWEAGDTTSVVDRPGASPVWLFGDTYIGRLQPNFAMDPAAGFANSSAMTEDGACITTHIGYYGMSLFTNPTDGTWYWPGGAVARADGSFDVMLTRLHSTSAPPPLNFEVIGAAVAHVRADMSIASIVSVPDANLAGTNGSGDPEVRPYGGSVTSDGTYAYLYAFVSESFIGIPVRLDQYVARVPLDSRLDGPWEYSTCAVEVDPGLACPERGWTTDPDAARPMDVDPNEEHASNAAPIAAFHVTRYGSGYVATAKGADLPGTEASSNQVFAWQSPSPAGPWTPIGNGPIGQATPTQPDAPGAWTYAAQLVHSPTAGWLLTWNQNADTSAVKQNVLLYGPEFAEPVNLPAPG